VHKLYHSLLTFFNNFFFAGFKPFGMFIDLYIIEGRKFMGKKLIYVILGLIVAIIVIAECFAGTHITSQADQIEKKITQKIERVFKD